MKEGALVIACIALLCAGCGPLASAVHQIHHDDVNCLAFSPDSMRLAAGLMRDRVIVFETRDLKTFQPVLNIDCRFVRIRDAAGRTRRQIVRADGTAEPYRGPARAFRDQNVRFVAFVAGGRELLVVGNDVVVFDARSGRELRRDILRTMRPRLRYGAAGVRGRFPIAVTPDGRRLLVSVRNRGGVWEQDPRGIVVVWDVATLRRIGRLEQPSRVYLLTVSPDSRFAATGDGRTVRIWDLETLQTAAILRGLPRHPSWIAFSPRGEVLATADDEAVRLWEWRNETCIAVARQHVEAICFSPDGSMLAVGSGREVVILDGRTGAVERRFRVRGRRVFPFREYPLWPIAFHPSGRALLTVGVTGAAYNTLQLWDPTSGRLICEVGTHAEDIRCVAFSPDGRWLASGSEAVKEPASVRIWRVPRRVRQRRGRAAERAVGTSLRNRGERRSVAVDRPCRVVSASPQVSARQRSLRVETCNDTSGGIGTPVLGPSSAAKRHRRVSASH